MKMLVSNKLIENIKKSGIGVRFEGNDIVLSQDKSKLYAKMSRSGNVITTTVYESISNKEIDNYDIDLEGIKNPDEIQEQIMKATDIYSAISEANLDSYTPGADDANDSDEDDSGDKEIITEEEPLLDTDTIDDEVLSEGDTPDIPSGLKTTRELAQDLGDKLRALSAATSDAEMVTVIMDLANSAYNLVLDIDDAYQTYVDLLQDDGEE